MFHFRGRHRTEKNSKPHIVDAELHGNNPFGSDSDSDLKPEHNRASSEPTVVKRNPKTSTYVEDDNMGYSSPEHHSSYAARNRYKNDFRDSGGFENQSVQELENYAVYKAEETTASVNNCLKIAEDIREDATKTMITLSQQGEQIARTHYTAVTIDQDLSRGEKLLGSLGGMFSKTWKPKKDPVKGPVLIEDNDFKRKGSHLEQREKFGLSYNNPRGHLSSHKSAEPTSAMEKVQVEKAKQDDGLSEISGVLSQLKDMAIDMGSEIDRQNVALDYLDQDTERLDGRIKGATRRGRQILGK